MKARGSTGPILDLVGMKTETSPMWWTGHVCVMETGMNFGMLGFQCVPVLDG